MIEKLKADLQATLQRIETLTPRDSHIDALSSAFHLGRVGGSGRNTYKLNKRREAYIDRTVKAAVELSELYKRRNALQIAIHDIESGEKERREQTAAIKEANALPKLVEYWNSLKVGDKIDIGGNDPAIITKKNAKSIETGKGCKWSAAEIIGKKAAALL